MAILNVWEWILHAPIYHNADSETKVRMRGYRSICQEKRGYGSSWMSRNLVGHEP